MTFRYAPLVPQAFADNLRSLTKEALVEVLWDCMMQSPWFDEATATRAPLAVSEKVHEIARAYRDMRDAERKGRKG